MHQYFGGMSFHFTVFLLLPCLSPVILCIVGIVLFPSGMDEKNINTICGPSSGAFKLGKCTIGWAYILIIIGTAIGAVAAAMSWTPARWRKRDTEGSYAL